MQVCPPPEFAEAYYLGAPRPAAFGGMSNTGTFNEGEPWQLTDVAMQFPLTETTNLGGYTAHWHHGTTVSAGW